MHGPRGGTRTARGRARALAACLAFLLTVGLTTAAHAQLGDVGEDTLDTDVTPVAKPSEKWEWWAGARYKGAPKPKDVPQGSATPFELDFFDVAFHDLNTGLAGGAICREPVPDRATSEEARAHTEQCERVPALYRYSVDAAGTSTWSPVDLGASTERRGYIGAIAWLDADTALAVGGNGCYPRREEPCPDGEVAAGDDPVAGKGRAWLYDGGSIAELDVPDAMRGLTALGTHSGGAFAGALRQIWRFQDGAFTTGWSGDSSAPQEVRYPELFQFRVRDIRGTGAVTAGCCRTDPLQSAGPRLLTFDGSTWIVGRRPSNFSNATGPLDDRSKSTPVGDLLPGAFDSVEGVVETVWGGGTFGDVTWLGVEGAYNTVDNLVYGFSWALEDGEWKLRESGASFACKHKEDGDGRQRTAPTAACVWNGGYHDSRVGFIPEGGVDETLGPWQVDPPNDLLPPSDETLPPRPDVLPPPPDTSGVRGPVNDAYRNAFAQLYGATKFMNGWGVDGHSVNTHTQAQAPDSYYALFSGGTVASPGGPPPEPGEDEPGSVISNGPSLLLTTARLLSADESPVKGGLEAVGTLRSSGQGILVGGDEHDPHRVNDSLLGNPQGFRANEEAHGCKIQDPAPAAVVENGIEQPECDTNAQRFLDQQRSLRLFKLDSYALNAIDVVEGAGWAVGDHGAIHARQPPPPPPPPPPQPPARAGAKLESESVSTDAFEEHRPPVTDEPGLVPPLAAQPQTTTIEPAIQGPYGPAISQGEVVMSRDGSEGWMLGRFADEFFHYDGGRWAPCDARGVPGLLPPDPACAELAKINQVTAVARVPLENDSDPSNDDEFEAVALTSNDGPYRYREGRWALDKDAVYRANPFSEELEPVKGEEIAFTAPDDGWVLTFTPGTFPQLTHFDGKSWTTCFFKYAACGDPNGRLAIQAPCAHHNPAAQLAVAGERVYLAATRDILHRPVSGACNRIPPAPRWQGEPYPVILYHDRGGIWRGGTDPDLADGYNPADGGWDPGYFLSGAGDPPIDPGLANPVPDSTARNAAKGAIGVANGAVTGRGDTEQYQGQIGSISVAREADGTYQGWALGAFGGRKAESADAAIMRLSDGHDVPDEDAEGTVKWRYWQVADAADDYLRDYPAVPSAGLLTFSSQPDGRSAFMFGAGLAQGQGLAFDEARDRWVAIPTPWAATTPNRTTTYDLAYTTGRIDAIAPDGQGGFWAAAKGGSYHFTDQAPEPVFEHTPAPGRGTRTTAFAAAADGTVWLGDSNGAVYRYDRFAGWSRPIRIPGWDPRQAPGATTVSAIAVGPNGDGVAVGPGGRIANLGEEVGLDPAATVGCGAEPVPPCGTARDLFAAGIAPDGSAIVIGEEGTLLWRPPGGDFRLVEAPPVPLGAGTVIEMPRPGRAYLLSEGSRVIRGEMGSPGAWRWEFEIGDADGEPDPLTRWRTLASGAEVTSPIRDIAIDASGHGFAVGDRGLLLERSGDGAAPWRRVSSGYEDNLQQVAVPPDGGGGALIGGQNGLIATVTESGLDVARHPDVLDPVIANGDGGGDFIAARFAGVALAPGYVTGDVEAWALLQGQRFGQPTQSLLHYSGASAQPLLDPARGLVSLSQAPNPAPGEISFAVFGKQDCDATNYSRQRGGGTFAVRDACGPPDGSNVTADLINRRIAEDLTEHGAEAASAQFAVFTGDAVDMPGGTPIGGGATVSRGPFGVERQYAQTLLDSDLKHRRWVELVANRLGDGGVPLFGALGGQDLAREAAYCPGPPDEPIRAVFLGGGCVNPRQAGAEQFGAEQGLSLPWRAAMASSPAPWEGSQQGGGLHSEPVEAGALSVQGPDSTAPGLRPMAPSDLDPHFEELPLQPLAGPRVRVEPYPLGSGDTHYAADVYRGEEKVARVVVVDTSMRSIAASDPQQHPIEAGGQLRWLDEMTCFEGSLEDLDSDVRDCTREPGQQAIVVSNTPTYSYGPISPEETQTDAAVFESVLFKNQVNVVVSGRLGWNGRYWALAPGVHAPCPGQPYRADSAAPSVTNPEICGAGGGAELDPDQATEQLPEEAQDAAGLATRGAIPFVVSSSAGGRFNVRAERGGLASAEAGFWRGYSIVRLHPSGDPSKTIVEQRPILDWVGIEAREQELEPRAEVDVRGYARETFGMDTLPRYYDIPDTEAITHRYHLLLADPDEPWQACQSSDAGCQALYAKLSLPPRSSTASQSSAAAQLASAASPSGTANPCDPYLCLPERVGTIDATTGEVSAGNGKYPNTFAIATLSVGDHVAAQPLVFKRSPSFIVNPAVARPSIPEVGADAGFSPNTPPPPNVPKPNVPQPNVPEPPAIPGVPPLAAAQPPEPQPPAPPSPPPPTEQPSPLDLTVSPTALTVAIPAAVIQPPTPPVNPAPPSGARREARQRQAATQKSGADSAESGSQHDVDLAGGPSHPEGAFTRHESSFTRQDRTRPAPSFTTLSARDPSSGSAGPLYIGGITLLALAAAMSWSGVRPTPKRRPPEVPAPALARARRWR